MGRSKRVLQSAEMIQSALFAMLKQYPYSDITISALCAQATVSRNTFYRIYKSKDEALMAALQARLLCLIRSFDDFDVFPTVALTQEDLLWVYKRFYSYWYEQKEFLLILQKQNLFPVFHDQYCKCFANHGSEEIIRRYYKREGKDYSNFYYLWQSYAYSALIEQWTAEGFQLTVEEISRLTVSLFSSAPFPAQTIPFFAEDQKG